MKEQDAGVKWFNTVFYPKNRKGSAVRYEDGILPRLRKDNITFFTPWGPRYDYEKRGVIVRESDREVEVLKFLTNLFAEIKKNMPDKNIQWIFLGADLYGTRINSLPEEIVRDYFSSLSRALVQLIPMVEFRLWSQFDSEAEEYREMIRVDFKDMINQSVVYRAEETARRMKRNSSAKEYIVERIAEAMLIEATFAPIKISCVAKHKDHGVDGNLPILYLLPENLQAPWL